MKTELILKKSWTKIAEYDFMIIMTKDDIVVSPNGMEYKVDSCILDLSENLMQILVI